MNMLNFRSLHQPLAAVGFFSNPWLLLAWTATVGLQLSAVYVPLRPGARSLIGGLRA